MDQSASMFLPRPASPLPTEKDFGADGGDLDAQCAWRNFGGLSLEKAYRLFLSNPLYYQEDFMFMGSGAFAYYFPVVDRYLRTVSLAPGELGDCEAAILGSAIVAQFEWKGAVLPTELRQEIGSLHAFVTRNLARYAATPQDEQRIRREWKRVAAILQKTSHRRPGDG